MRLSTTQCNLIQSFVLLACACLYSNKLHSQNIITGSMVSNNLVMLFEHGTPLAEIDSIREEFQAVEIGFTARTNAYLWQVPDVIELDNGKKLTGIEQREHAKKDTAVEDADFNWITNSVGGSQVAQAFSSDCQNYQTDWQYRSIMLDGANSLIQNGSNSQVLVAILDTGVDIWHPDLAAYIWTNPAEIPDDGLDNDGNGYIDDTHGYNFLQANTLPLDDHSHGTHIAGLIRNTALAVNPRLMVLKTQDCQGNGTMFGLVSAIDYAVENGASIINMSLGYYGESSPILSKAIKLGQVNNEDVLYVTSSGNNTLDVDETPHFPSGYQFDNIIAVAATDDQDQLSIFSDYGMQSVDIASPGNCIMSTLPSYSLEEKPDGSNDQNPPSDDTSEAVCGQIGASDTGLYYGLKEGTSMSAALVTGTAALLKGEHPNLPHHGNRSAILCNVDTQFGLSGLMTTEGRLNIYETLLNVNNCGFLAPNRRTQSSLDATTSSPYLANEKLFFDIQSEENQSVIINIFSMNGRQLASLENHLSKGKNQIYWDILPNMAKGVYIYQAILEEKPMSGKFLVK